MNTKTFIYKAQQWQDTWNFYKPSYGKDMYGLTPSEKLKKSKTSINSHILKFPVLLMENLLKYAWLFDQFLKFNIMSKGGKYVYTKCLILYP